MSWVRFTYAATERMTFLNKVASLRPHVLIHQKPAGPFQEDGRPAGRVRRVNPLADHGVNLIPFKRQWDEGMAQPVEHPGGFHPRKTAFPLGDGVLVGT